MKAPTISRRIWLIASTVAVIGGLFAYYFFVYMEARRVELEAKKFRALAQYAENISEAYAERTKKIYQEFDASTECLTDSVIKCVPIERLKQARFQVVEPIVAQSDFSELVFEVKNHIERQTFKNSIDAIVVSKILNKDDASTKRQVEYKVNDTDYVIFIHSFELDRKSWRIFGFCSKDQFESQIRAVDLKYVVVASLLLILILLMMPLLKLLIMNESEKLHMMNVWFCGFSLVVGSSSLLLILLMSSDFSATYSFDDDELGDKLSIVREAKVKKLSAAVEKEFVGELKKINAQFDAIKLIRHFGNGDTCTKDGGTKLYPLALSNDSIKFRHYPFFNEMLWIRHNGTQDTVISTHELSCEELVNLKTRKYFNQAFFKDSTWSVPDSKSGTERFALQSIRSYLTDHHEAGFGRMRHKNDTTCGVIAIATKLHSVMDPMLPPGYQFAIIDASGKVWFHSETEKNLNENFIDETSEDRKLIAALNSRSEALIRVNYGRSNHIAFVSPLKDTGLNLIVLHNDDFFSIPIVLTVGFAFLLVTILFFILGLHQLILLTSTYRFSLLKVRRFFLAWLRPDKEKRRIYRRAVALHLILFILTAWAALVKSSLDLVVFFFVLPLYLTVYHYSSLEHKRNADKKGSPARTRWPHPFLIASSLLILFVNWSGIYLFDLEEFGFLIISQIVVVLILLFFYLSIVIQPLGSPMLLAMGSATRLVSGIFTKLRLQPPGNGYRNSYYNFLFLWVILTSVIPTYYFYKTGYYEEGKIWLRYLQLSAARQQEIRDAELDNELSNVFKSRVKEMSDMGNYLTVTQEIDTSKYDLTEFYDAKSMPIHGIIFNDVPSLTGVAEETRATIFPSSGDSMWMSREKDRSSVMEYFTKQRQQRFYKSELPKFKSLKGDYRIFFIVVIILGVILLYRTLRFCITHIYGVGLLEDNRYKTPQLSTGARYFIVGLPHSGKSKLVKMIRRKQKIQSAKVVYLNDDATLDITEDCQLVVAKGFHLDLHNHKINQIKLKKLETLAKHRDLRVIVISNIDPSTILDVYDKLADYYRNEEGDFELDGDYRQCKQAYDSWNNILKSYSVHYHKLRECKQFQDKDINAELDHGEFLPRLYHQLKAPILTTQEHEKMVLQVEDLSQTYYRAIWNCLSTSEKFLLHDLAKDRFVNMRNMKSIRALRQKGLMVGGNSLEIMNKSFNNFILSIVEDDVDVKMEQQIRQKGSWNTVHLILVITIISIVIFLGVAQQELFKNFQAILAATAALLPLLARFGGIFTGSKGKE